MDKNPVKFWGEDWEKECDDMRHDKERVPEEVQECLNRSANWKVKEEALSYLVASEAKSDVKNNNEYGNDYQNEDANVVESMNYASNDNYVQHQSMEGNKDNDKSVAETNIDLYSNSNTNDFPAMEAVRENLDNDKEYEFNEEKLKSLDEDQNKLPNIENSIPEPSNDEYELSFDVKKEVDSGNADVPDGTYKTNISNRYIITLSR